MARDKRWRRQLETSLYWTERGGGEWARAPTLIMASVVVAYSSRPAGLGSVAQRSRLHHCWSLITPSFNASRSISPHATVSDDGCCCSLSAVKISSSTQSWCQYSLASFVTLWSCTCRSLPWVLGSTVEVCAVGLCALGLCSCSVLLVLILEVCALGLCALDLCSRSVFLVLILEVCALGLCALDLCCRSVFLVLVAQTGRAFIADHGQVMSDWVITASSSDGHWLTLLTADWLTSV